MYAGSGVYTCQKPGQIWSLLFSDTDVGNPGGFSFPTAQTVMGIAVNRYSTDEILVLGSVIVTIFTTTQVYTWYGSTQGVTLQQGISYFNPSSSSGDDRYGQVVAGGTGWIVIFYDDSGEDTSALAFDHVGLDFANPSIMADVIEFGGGGQDSIITTQSIKTQNVAIAKLRVGVEPRITYNGGLSWSTVTNAPAPYQESPVTVFDRFESIISNDDGSIILTGMRDSSGLRYTLDYGASWITSSVSGHVTSVWHLDEDAFLYATKLGIFVIDDLATGSATITDKTGNLLELMSGTFEVMGMRHYIPIE